MTINKDQSIITQVAAKIAADLTPKGDDVMENISNWIMAFDACTDALFAKHGFTEADTQPAPAPAPNAVDEAMRIVTEAFPTATVTDTPSFTVRIKGKQHGPIPEWLISECAKKGVTEVWDNRDGLAVNPKRPWFKSTTGTEAFWAPKGAK